MLFLIIPFLISIPSLLIPLQTLQYYTTYLLTFFLLIKPVHPAISHHCTRFIIGHISMDIIRQYRCDLYFLSVVCGILCFIDEYITIASYTYSLLYILCNCDMHVCYLITTIQIMSSALYNQPFLTFKETNVLYVLQTIYLYQVYGMFRQPICPGITY